MIKQLLWVGLLNWLAAMSPGPDFAIVTANSLRGSVRGGLLTAAGIACAITIHISYCSLGIAVIITQHPTLYKGLRMLGSLYLIYLGTRILWQQYKYGLNTNFASPNNKKLIANGNYFIEGFLTCLLNPKAIIFFVAIYSTIIKPVTIMQGFIFGIVMIFIAGGWFSCLTLLIENRLWRHRIHQLQPYFMITMGGLLLLFGIGLFFE